MDKEKNEYSTIDTITISIDEYKTLISEHTKFKTQVEQMNVSPKKEVVLEIEQSHVKPQTKQKKGFFTYNE